MSIKQCMYCKLYDNSPHISANKEMSPWCYSRPVTLDGLVPTAKHNDACRLGQLTITMTSEMKTDTRDTGTFILLYDWLGHSDYYALLSGRAVCAHCTLLAKGNI